MFHRLSNPLKGRKVFKGPLLLGCVLFLLASIFGASSSLGASQDLKEVQEARLTADQVVYEEDTGVASAFGRARLVHGDLRLFAENIVYDTQANRVEAWSPGGEVTVLSKGRRLNGLRLVYSLDDRSGVLSSAHGEDQGVFIRGSDLEFMPLEEAISRGLVSRKAALEVKGKKTNNAKDAAVWRDVSATTCELPSPHYLLKSKQVVVAPGRSTVIRKPQVYLGGRLLFNYPFDYVVKDKKDKKEQQDSFVPFVKYDSSKGVGVGISGPLEEEGLDVSMGLIGWTKVDPEGWVEANYRLSDWASVFGRVDRVYDTTMEEMLWRPKWGARWTMGDVSGSALWSQRELLKVEKTLGRSESYFLYREPEISLYGPWAKAGEGGLTWRLGVLYGRYEESRKDFERKSISGELAWSGLLGSLRPRFYLSHLYHSYGGGDHQGTTYGEVGVDWRLGEFDMSTVYARRWVSGSSPMEWDRYSEAENLYQTTSFYLGDPKGDYNWRISVQAGYDLKASSLARMVYTVSYKHHCLIWDLVMRDNRSDGDRWFGFNLRLKDAPPRTFEDSGYYEPMVQRFDEIYNASSPASSDLKEDEAPEGGVDR
ncbi:MAG: hypothetical protein N2315_06355 [Thermanaerothrix sp.]|nr:hypothetical protein [Thermanaerothrix sp.]